jgi:hypothetical protein
VSGWIIEQLAWLATVQQRVANTHLTFTVIESVDDGEAGRMETIPPAAALPRPTQSNRARIMTNFFRISASPPSRTRFKPPTDRAVQNGDCSGRATNHPGSVVHP